MIRTRLLKKVLINAMSVLVLVTSFPQTNYAMESDIFLNADTDIENTNIEDEADSTVTAIGIVSFDDKDIDFSSQAPEYDIDSLGVKERRLYEILKPEFDKIASGEIPAGSENTVLTCQILDEQLVYTYDELGIVSAIDSADYDSELILASKDMLGVDLQAVSEALFQGCSGCIKWDSAKVEISTDHQYVYIADSLLWTVYIDVVDETENEDEKEILKTTEDTDEEAADVETGKDIAGKADVETSEEEISDEQGLDDTQDTSIDEQDAEKAEKTADATDVTDEETNLDDEDIAVEDAEESDAEDKITEDKDLEDIDAENKDTEDTESENIKDAEIAENSKLVTTSKEHDFTLMGGSDDEDDLDGDESAAGLWIKGIEDSYPYRFAPVTIPGLQVYFGKKLLTENVDYTVAYKNNNKAGTATVTVTGKGNYTGSCSQTFEIVQAYSSETNATALTAQNIAFCNFEAALTYNGQVQKQDSVDLSYNGDPLVEDTDYVISFNKEPVNVGSYTVTYTGIGQYKGSLKKTFKIVAAKITDADVSAPVSVPYRKGGAKPEVTAVVDGRTLVAGTDYTVAYKNNTKAGAAAKVTVTGKGNFTGTVTRDFTIGKNTDAQSIQISATDKTFVNKSGNYITTVSLKDSDGKALVAGTDYVKALKYYYAEDTELPGGVMRYEGDEAGSDDIVPAGVVMTVTAVLSGNYEGTVSTNYRITGQDISRATIKVGNQYYTGKEICPDKTQITIIVGKTVLTDSDYEIISYENNVNKGTGKLTVRGVGEFGGIKTATFTIAARTTSYMIAFYGNGATAGSMSNQKIAIGKSAKLNANKFSRTNYLFTGWNTKADGTGDQYADLTTISAQQFNSGSVLTLYAQWNQKVVTNYTITYHGNGGPVNNSNATSYNVLSGDIRIDAPLKEEWPVGYQFGGWYKENNYKTRVSVIKSGSTGNINLYAKWIPYGYTVRFEGNGATSGEMADEGFSFGVSKNLIKNTYKRTDYTFLGWSMDKDSETAQYTDAQMVKDLVTTRNSSSEVVTLYAVWSKYYKINYVLNAPEESVQFTGEKIVAGRYGCSINMNAIKVTRSGYDFAGWYKDAALKSKLTTTPKNPTTDVTVYAKWTPWTYKIRYVGGPGTTGKMADQTVKTENVTIANNTYKKSGQTFVGWSMNLDATTAEILEGQVMSRVSLAPSSPNEVITLFAVWSDSAEIAGSHNGKTEYTVSFVANTPAGTKATGKTADQKINYEQTKALNKNMYSVKGYEFVGWNTDINGTGSSFADQEQVRNLPADAQGKVTLYAIWNMEEYSITYENIYGDNGSNPDSYNVNTTANAAIVLNAPSAIGQNFAGWYSDPALKKKVTNIPKGATGDKVFYAKWTSNHYTISYNLNCQDATLDTTGAGYVRSYLSGSDNGYVLATAKRSGYRFGGWYLDAACKKPVSFINGAPTVDMTVYAKWIVGCDHNRSGIWINSTKAPTCTTTGIDGKVCRYCGLVQSGSEVPALGHDEVVKSSIEPTCYATGLIVYECSRCGVTRTETVAKTNNHNYEWVVSKEPTALEFGKKIHKCSDCGNVDAQEDIPPLEHEHDYKITESKRATVAEEGYYQYKCTICGATKTETTAKILCTHPSYYEEIQIIQEATCTEDGKKHVTCSLCGYEKDVTVKALGHDEETEIIKEVTCAEAGSCKVTCKRCGLVETKTIAAIAHGTIYSKTTKAPTHQETGVKSFICSVCEQTISTETIPILHDGCGTKKVLVKKATCNSHAIYKDVCSVCDEILKADYEDPTSELLPHSYDEASCVEYSDGTRMIVSECTVCGDKKEETIENHTHSYVETECTATCSSSGNITYKCEFCDHTKSEYVSGGHPHRNYELIQVADCTHKNIYKVTCNDCGEVLNTNYTKNEDKKDYNNHTCFVESSRSAATVKSTGLILYTCQGCGHSYLETIPKLECKHTSTTKRVEDGVGYVVCYTCGEKLSTYDIQAECSHTFGSNYVERIKADEDTWGEIDRCCAKCGKVLHTNKIHPYKKYEVVDKNGKTVTLYGWFDYDYAHQVMDLTNEYRKENGTTTLTYNECLQYASDIRALEAAVYWSHTRPNGARWNTLDSKWTYGGENLANGHLNPADVMVGWKNSAGHNRNLLYGTQAGDTPYRGISVSCFHRYTFSDLTPGVVYETLVWSQHFTFYEYN